MTGLGHDRPLRIGIIGLGQAGSGTVNHAVKNGNFQVTAAADLNKDSLNAFKKDFPEAQIYSDVLSLVQDDNVDAVYIATPTRLHRDHAVMAAEHRKHVLVEKPIAKTLEEADEMIAAARKNGVVLMVNHKRSYDQPMRKMREIIKSGELGRVRMIHNWHYSDWLYRPRTPEELSDGGVVLRQGAHHFDMIRFLGGGKVRSVKAAIGIWDPNRSAEGSYTAYLDFEDGTVATSVYSGYDHFQFTELTGGIGVEGRRRTSWFTDPNTHAGARKKLKQAGGTDGEKSLKKGSGYGSARQKDASSEAETFHPFFGFNLISCERGDIRQSPEGLYLYGDEEKWEVKLPCGETGLDALLHEFQHAVVQHRPPVHDGAYGKACLEICLAVVESSRERKDVLLHHQPEIID